MPTTPKDPFHNRAAKEYARELVVFHRSIVQLATTPIEVLAQVISEKDFMAISYRIQMMSSAIGQAAFEHEIEGGLPAVRSLLRRSEVLSGTTTDENELDVISVFNGRYENGYMVLSVKRRDGLVSVWGRLASNIGDEVGDEEIGVIPTTLKAFEESPYWIRFE